MPTLSLVPVAHAEQWDEVVLGAELGTPFHAWAFLTAYAASVGVRFVPLLVVRGGQVVGGVPLLERRRGPLRWSNLGLSFSYAGPAVAREDLAEVLALVGARQRWTTMRERLEVRADPAALAAPGWKVSAGESMSLRLAGRSDLELRGAATKKFRQHLGHADRSGVVVGPATVDEVDERLTGWVAERFEAQSLASPFTAELVGRVRRSFLERGGFHADAARVDGEVIGVQATLVLGAVAYPWLIGVSADHEHANPATALSWRLLTWARAEGLDEVDLSGAPNDGIRHFKHSMGADSRSYAVLERGLRV